MIIMTIITMVILRQQPRHTMDSILAHLATSIMYDMAPKAFLEKYLVSSPVLQVGYVFSWCLRFWHWTVQIILFCENSINWMRWSLALHCFLLQTEQEQVDTHSWSLVCEVDFFLFFSILEKSDNIADIFQSPRKIDIWKIQVLLSRGIEAGTMFQLRQGEVHICYFSGFSCFYIHMLSLVNICASEWICLIGSYIRLLSLLNIFNFRCSCSARLSPFHITP